VNYQEKKDKESHD